ncbi:LanC-like protein [Paraburkholderia acidicola]|uniref:LanC-like protein n=1 Tax=Paraburkholderia acidicola TaxID=1912599 RepID=A0ABV1LRG9_9BURK
MTLFDPARHEPLIETDWDEHAARATIQHIAAGTHASFNPDTYWPTHALDGNPADTLTQLYHGACGTFWALAFLESIGAATPGVDYAPHYSTLLGRNRIALQDESGQSLASYMMGDVPILLLEYQRTPTEQLADKLAALILSNLDNPTRELMWGSPGTLLASKFLYERTSDERWADLFRLTADKLWSELLWSPEHACFYWTQDLYGKQSTYLDSVHGFVATAVPLIAGRHLLTDERWNGWRERITTTIARTAVVDDGKANWHAQLIRENVNAAPHLMQFCHGAPGFVICLADMPGDELDTLLLAAGEATWAAGPLRKGSNLCHGTGGNGFAFLSLYRRTGDSQWLHRARAFAMHGIAQTMEAERQYGQLRYSLWTGDPGFAIYLWNCIHGTALFPTLDFFFTDVSTRNMQRSATATRI